MPTIALLPAGTTGLFAAAQESGSRHPILLGLGVFAFFVLLLLITFQFNKDR